MDFERREEIERERGGTLYGSIYVDPGAMCYDDLLLGILGN
jgi:hypothetical protein